MDYSQYKAGTFDQVSALNLSTDCQERSFQAHWHSYGEIILVGPGEANVFMVNQATYELAEGDFILIWPMEMHAIIDADRKESLVIQFSNGFVNSLFDLQRIMHFYRNLHVLCIHTHIRVFAHLSLPLHFIVPFTSISRKPPISGALWKYNNPYVFSWQEKSCEES